MKSLKEYITEGILDIEDNIENADKVLLAHDWLDEWKFFIQGGKVNNDGTIDAKSVIFYNSTDLEIPEYIQFNNVDFFKVQNCRSIKDCHGFPIKCDNAAISDNDRLSSLEGFHKNTYYKRLYISDDYDQIRDLSGLPNVEKLELHRLRFINDLKGISDCEDLLIDSCRSLKSLKGISKNIKKLRLEGCRFLKDLTALPKKKLKRFSIWLCKIAEEDAEKYLDKDGILYYERIANYNEW